ncbi:hypothetical protein [Candidatus Halobonum tyrrellensis]|uniref:PRC-barrel domain-containing protein n=1 Tax=Candidatus Halobonum tyrrellensis G22 TaxID=1324957 RepID=V4HAE6_9EURY|nr:hypothetical protein [Candidatus Halobonum tyrrellensis]ESP87680.1 hypothetical protein K933_12705 [Candidatus Halobonum tyrrellensis G22]
MATLTEEDSGKILVDAEGEELGIVTGVENGTAYFDPDPSVSEGVLAAFGHADTDSDDLELPFDSVETVTDDEVRLTGDV